MTTQAFVATGVVVRRATPSVRGRRGFTLIELLVVISIIALLISILLPSLGGARRSAWNVICASNLRQLGVATQSYLDDQKDPIFLNIRADTDISHQTYWHAVKQLQDYLGGAGSKPFDCPAAKGRLSVRTTENLKDLEKGLRYFCYPYQKPNGPWEYYTEYFINDSRILPGDESTYPTGVSSQKIRLMRHPEEVVWMMDGMDEYPRHQDKGQNQRDVTNRRTTAKSNILFGDLRVQAVSIDQYTYGRDKYGSWEYFYNWGHVYSKNP